ncbi:hypothetical protein N431DRAFT_553040 [Stipitochalara longipes BDJ]|nr:hypothetical protein N431DRAFT_553040 [Stipitochalara longipes BDJ]
MEVPATVIQFVDCEVLAALPEGTRIKGIFPHGASYWTRTAEIRTEQVDGSPRSFFLKVCQGEVGRGMMLGEFESMKQIYLTIPDLAPTPIAWGMYVEIPDTYFFLCSFIDMTEDIPDIEKFPARVAELHLRGLSPNGKFGFVVQTYQGRLSQVATWTDSWEECFANNLRGMLNHEQNLQGPNKRLEDLSQIIFQKVIPRLLRPLETGGRQIQARLVHGDLWDGNCSTAIDTESPVIYDASALYAHNEYDLASWRCTRHRIGKSYMKAYHRHFPISAPEEDHDDRNLLYAIRFDACSSALYPGNLIFRNIMIDEMQYLVDKYPLGFEA